MPPKRVKGVSSEALADALGDSNLTLDEPEVIRPGAGEFEELLEEIGMDAEDKPAESGDVDEFALMERMPKELRPQFAAFLRRQRESAPKPAPEARQTNPDVAELLRAVVEQGRQRPKAEDAEEPKYKVMLDEQKYGDLIPVFQDFVDAHFKELRAAKAEAAAARKDLSQLRENLQRDSVASTFESMKQAYRDDYKKLVPRVEEVFQESPELAMTTKGIARAFKIAKQAEDYEALVAELKAHKRGGAVPGSRVGRPAARQPVPGADKVGSFQDAARFAVRQMRELGFGDLDEV